MLVTLLTFPLIWLGGLVTTHDAGMAVPDWPGTFGYNLFLYPWSAWLYGPFDLFVEHGHRLLASLVGLLAICLCVVAYRNEKRIWVRNLCFAFLAAIISQGVLGGVRVLLDARTAAMIHGCTGPLVFATGSFIVMACSTDWRRATQNASTTPVSRGLQRISYLLVFMSVVQLFVGAQLRHAQPTWLPPFFTSIVHTHLLMATLITLSIFGIFVLVRADHNRRAVELRLPANMLLLIVVAQIALGLATWIANYATPWMELTPWLAKYTLQGKGFWESMIVTGHQATGSLLIVCSLWMVCRIATRTNKAENSQPMFKDTSIQHEKATELVAVGGKV
jgi:cytochrome c oxidase assembly protein subunit 15